MTRAKFKSFWDKFGTLSILILIMICLSIASPKYFMTPDNVKQIGLQSTVYILLAFGEFFAILLAGIDLSVGSVAEGKCSGARRNPGRTSDLSCAWSCERSFDQCAGSASLCCHSGNKYHIPWGYAGYFKRISDFRSSGLL